MTNKIHLAFPFHLCLVKKIGREQYLTQKEYLTQRPNKNYLKKIVKRNYSKQ